MGGLESIRKILEESPEFEPWEGYLKAFEYITEVISKPMVERGLTGVRTGKGFYSYPEPGKYRKVEISENLAERVNPAKALAVAANTSAWCVTNGIGSMEDVDKCFQLAYSWPQGVFEFIKQYGPKNLVRELRCGVETAPEPMKLIYKPDPLLLNMI
jgi:3-hydroxyacyl-CoA dehydrogenase